ncbi:MAG: hypothetical protein LBD87_03770, partial [Prevotellaceae bacterium]|nr:hypothetical protein [Prevotellaceae bacterium]
MQGQVDFSIPDPAVAGREISFQVSNGIVDPDKNLTFDWSAPDFTPSTYTGEVFLAVSPATPGIYPIFLTVRAAGYRDIVIKNDVKLELAHCTPMIGSLRIEGPSGAYMNEDVVFTAAGIAVPEESDLEYRWTTSGGFTPGTFTGKEFHTKIGATPNTYTVYLEAVDTKGRYCPSDTSKAVSNACTPMSGALEFAAEPTGYIIAKGSTVKLTAGGIQTPSTGVQYVWSLPGFENITYLTSDNSVVSVWTPSNVYGEREVTVTAQAAGYCPTTQAHTLKIVDCIPMEGQLKLTLNGTRDETTGAFRQGTPITASASGITTPANLLYEWTTSPNIPATPTTNNTWSATLPNAVNNYTLTAKAKAATTSINYCEVSKDTVISVGTVGMAGNLSIEASGDAVTEGRTLRPGSPVQFVAKGIAYPPVANITYGWSVTGLGVTPPPPAVAHDTWSFLVPASATHADTYTVTVIASAVGYSSQQCTITGTVKKDMMTGALELQFSGDGIGTNSEGKNTLRPASEVTFTAKGITAPLTGLSYTWDWRVTNASAPTATVITTSPVNSWKITAPSATTDKYTASVKVEATGYNPAIQTAEFIIDNTIMSGNLQIYATGDDEEVTDATDKITVRPGADVLFEAKGITVPASVTYEWAWKGAALTSPSTATGSTWGVKMPDNAQSGNYTLVVTAKAAGYKDKVTEKLVVVKAAGMSGTLDIKVNGLLSSVPDTIRPGMEISFEAAGITKPTNNLTYEWEWGLYGATPSSTETKTNDNTWKITAGATGHHVVKVTVKSYGYEPYPVSKAIIVKAPEMAGDLTVQADGAGVSGNTLRPAANVTFKVNGVTSPATGVKYDWTVQYNSDAAQTYPDIGVALDFQIPSSTVTGSYTVSVTARAAGYADLTGVKVFTVATSAMTGDLTVKASGEGVIDDNTLRPASNVTFKVNGVTAPATGVTYDWTVQYNNETSPTTYPNRSNNLDFPVPSTATGGNYTVWVTAKAGGYADWRSENKVFAITPAVMAGNISITATGDGVTSGTNGTTIRPKSTVTFAIQNGITQPADGITYEWAVTGAPSITPPSGATTATVWVTTIPDVSAETPYTIKVTAKKDGYVNKETSLPVSVTPATLAGTPEVVIVTSAPAANQDGSFRPGSKVDFRVNGLTGLPAGVTYAWTWTPPAGAAVTASSTENTWSTTIGTAAGDGTVAVTVQADGYAGKSANRTVSIQKTNMQGTLTIVPTGTMRTIDNTLCFLPGSTVRFEANMTNPPAGVTYEWEVKNNGGGGAVSTYTGSPYDYTATLLNTSSDVIGDILNIKLTAKADGYADKETKINANIRCFPFIYSEAVPKITYTSGGGSTIYTGAEVIFTAPVITDPNNGANATYAWLATTGTSGTGRQWTILAPATPTTGFGASVTIAQNGYCQDIRSLPGLSVNCQPYSGTLTAYADAKTVGDIYFNKASNLILHAIYNGTVTATSYTWNIGGQYERTETTANHTIDATATEIQNLTAPGTYTLTVTAKSDACVLQTVSYNIFVSYCPYTGSDLLVDATHECKEITASSSTYYQAYIKESGGQTYRIVRLPPTNTNLWWFAENSKLG